MDKKVTIEKKYKIEECDISTNINRIINDLGLSDCKEEMYHDEYLENDDILEAYRITVRKRSDNGKVYYTLKKNQEIGNGLIKREVHHFSTFEDLMTFLKNNYNLVIEVLHEKLLLDVKRRKYTYKYKNVLVEICTDETTINGSNEYMIECKYTSGSLEDFLELTSNLKKYKFLQEINANKKELGEKKVPKNTSIPFGTKVDLVEYDKSLNTYFGKSLDLLEKLKRLNERKEHIRQLHEKYGPLERPIVVTISGTPRAGKTTCIDNLFEFFKKADFKTICVDEPAGLVYATLKSKEEKQELLKDRIGFVERQLEIGRNKIGESLNGNEILLCDRGILDTFIWYDMYYKLGMMDKERYQKFLKGLTQKYPYFNQLYILYTSSLTSMYRDYQNSLSIEPRSTMNKDNVRRYNSSLIRMFPTFERSIDDINFINTTNYAKMDASIVVSNDLVDKIENLYRRRAK